MEVSNNSTLAVSAYAVQQQQSPPRSRDGDTETADPNRSAETSRRDNVNFSSEALRLSAQNNPTAGNPATVNATGNSANAGQQQQPARPEVVSGQSATTVAQAINAYRSTSVY